MDRLYGWKSSPYRPIRQALKDQKGSQNDEFKKRLDHIRLQLAEVGLNTDLYWDNRDPKHYVSMIPTSAMTGEGIPDLLFVLVKMSQTNLQQRITLREELQCTVLEVKSIEGHGTTVDVILVNGELRENDRIVLGGLSGPIVTQVRALLTPEPLKELRVSTAYERHERIRAAMGVKISAPGLEQAVAGTTLHVCNSLDPEDLEKIKEDVEREFEEVINTFDRKAEGVYVAASTLGSLEALLEFLKTSQIPVAQVSIGEVHLADVRKAGIMLEKKSAKDYGVILAFDVKINAEAQEEAAKLGVKIMTADIIYHLFDQFTVYMKGIKDARRDALQNEAVFPAILRIGANQVFNKKDPIVVGVDVVEGLLKVGTPLCVPDKDFLYIGRVGSIEKDHKPIDKAVKGDAVAIKISSEGSQVTYGRQFDHNNHVYSQISRASIDCLKANFREAMTTENWKLIKKMKKVFSIE